MINKLIDGAKKSRTIRLSLIDAVVGGIVAAAPLAIESFSNAPVITPDSPLSLQAVYYITIGSGIYKLWSGARHAYLRFDTHGSVGE